MPSGSQGLDRYAYTFNNPVNFTDPTGHSAWQNDGGGPGSCDLDCIRARHQGDDGSNGNLPPKNSRINIGTVFDPFVGKLPPCPADANGRCIPFPLHFRNEIEFRFDILRIDRDQLTYDLAGLGLSLVGEKSLQSALELSEDAVKYVTWTHGGLSFLSSVHSKDLVGGVATAASIHPAVAIYASSFSVIRDMSASIYTVKVHNLFPGPPAGAYCDGNYGC